MCWWYRMSSFCWAFFCTLFLQQVVKPVLLVGSFFLSVQNSCPLPLHWCNHFLWQTCFLWGRFCWWLYLAVVAELLSCIFQQLVVWYVKFFWLCSFFCITYFVGALYVAAFWHLCFRWVLQRLAVHTLPSFFSVLYCDFHALCSCLCYLKM